MNAKATAAEIAARLANLNSKAARASLEVSALFTITRDGKHVSYNDKIEDAEAAIRDALITAAAAFRQRSWQELESRRR